MYELGLGAPFWVIVLIWLAKVILLALVSTLLAWLGIRVLDALTPRIHQRQRIGESPVATGLFIAGFFIFSLERPYLRVHQKISPSVLL